MYIFYIIIHYIYIYTYMVIHNLVVTYENKTPNIKAPLILVHDTKNCITYLFKCCVTLQMLFLKKCILIKLTILINSWM